MGKIILGSAVVAALTFGITDLASARPVHAYAPDQSAAYSTVPNIPDLKGCVKWCFRDTGPCDPPAFKRADGRCNLND